MDGYKVDGANAMWHPRGLSNLQGALNGNILRFTIDHSQETSIWEEYHEILHLLGCFSIRKYLLGQETKVSSTLL